MFSIDSFLTCELHVIRHEPGPTACIQPWVAVIDRYFDVVFHRSF